MAGDRRWSRPCWRDIGQYGAMIVAPGVRRRATRSGSSIPRTGAVRVGLDGWRPVTGSGGTDHLLVTRAVQPAARTMVAVARPDGPKPRLLSLPIGTGGAARWYRPGWSATRCTGS